MLIRPCLWKALIYSCSISAQFECLADYTLAGNIAINIINREVMVADGSLNIVD